MPQQTPNYSWVDLNLDERKGDDFIEQYSEFCKARGIPFDQQPYLVTSKFAYTPPPENMGLAAFSPQACDLNNVAGSLRKLPQLPFETEWTSVESFREPCQEEQDDALVAGKSMHPSFLQNANSSQQMSPSQHTSPSQHGQEPFVSGSVAIPRRGDFENLTQEQVTGWAEMRTMPNQFQIRQGTFASTLPSRNGAGLPFNGLWNKLSQSYDLNVDVSDTNPELRQERYQPTDWQDEKDARILDFALPDQLQQAANRYTKLVGVSKDYTTGAYMLHYGRDEMIDYKGRVYNAPPTVNLGAPNPLLDKLTNTGTYPNTRGQFMERKPQTNDMNPAKAPTNGFEGVALRDWAMQNATRSRLNTRGEHLQPISANANANNPAQAVFSPYGSFGARSMATTSNVLKVLSDDQIAAQPDMSRASFQNVVMPGHKQLYQQDVIQRQGQVYDYGSMFHPNASNAKELNIQTQIEAQGMADKSIVMDSSRQQSMQTTYAPTANGPVQGQGMGSSETSINARSYSLGFQSQQPQIEAAGMASKDQLQGTILGSNSRQHTMDARYYGTGYAETSSPVFAAQNNVGKQLQIDRNIFQGEGYTITSSAQQHRNSHIGHELHIDRHRVNGDGMTETSSMLKHAARHHQQQTHHATPHIEGAGLTETQTALAPKTNTTMTQVSSSSAPVYGIGYGESSAVNGPYVKTSMQQWQSAPNVYAQGMGDSSSFNGGKSFSTTMGMQPTMQQGYDASGYADSSQTIAKSNADRQFASGAQAAIYGQGYGSSESLIGQQATQQASNVAPTYTSTVYATGYGDQSQQMATAKTYNITAAGPSQTEQSQTLERINMLSELPKMQQQPAYYMDAFREANSITGGPRHYTSTVDDGTAQQLLPQSLYMQEQSGASKSLNVAMQSAQRQIVQGAGSNAFDAMQQKEINAGRSAFVANNIVGLLPTTPSSGVATPQSPTFEQTVYGMQPY